MANSYTVSDIEIKSDIGHMRERSGMYIGESADPSHLLVEAIDNSVDEVMNNDYKVKVSVEVIEDYEVEGRNLYRVTDTGRGIPIGTRLAPDNKERPVSEILTLFSKSGGKFGKDAFKISGGLHGIGMTVMSSLSEITSVKSTRDGKIMKSVIYHDPKLGKENFQDEVGVVSNIYDHESDTSGTEIEFIPDPRYFSSTRIPHYFIIEKCKIVNANFQNCVELVINGEIIDTSAEFRDLSELTEDMRVYQEYQVNVNDDKGQSVNYLLAYTNASNYSMNSYVNNIFTRLGGTHALEMRKSITKAWWDYVKSNIKDDDVDYEISRMKWDDVLVGLYGAQSVMLINPHFSSQNKEKLITNQSEFSELYSNVYDSVSELLVQDKDVTLSLFKRFVEYRRSKDKLSDIRDISKLIKLNDSKDKSKTRRRSVVDKLKDCTNPGREGTELLIVEGNSAGSGFEVYRDKATQAILPLRGVIKNTSGLSVLEALKSQEIVNIINSIGAGAGNEDEADPALARYDKIIYIGDADSDGSRITALVANVFVSYLKPLVEAGMIYVMYPPLFGYVDSKGVQRFTDEIDEIPKKLVESGNFMRYKGLGEMEPEDIRDVCLNRDNRTIHQLQYPENIEDFDRILGSSSGRLDISLELGLLVRR